MMTIVVTTVVVTNNKPYTTRCIFGTMSSFGRLLLASTNVVMTVSRVLVCWRFVNQQLVMIVGFCNKKTMMVVVVATVIVDNNKR